MVDCLAVIPARGGSKGIPRKNMYPIAGRPLLSYVLREALAARQITRVAVSTDDPEIAAFSRELGATVIDRPADISGDRAPSEAAVLHALATLENKEGYKPDLVAMLQCTSPLTLALDIDGAIATLTEKAADTCLTATPFFHFLWREGADGGAEAVGHDASRRLMRQQMTPRYLENGALYLMRTAEFRKVGFRFFGRTVIHPMPVDRHLEIDDLHDIELANLRLRERQNSERAAALPARISALVLDFDGVLTNNRVLLDERGVESVVCDRGDGFGLESLRRRGLRILVISREVNSVVAARCRKLQIECVHGTENKRPILQTWLSEHGVASAETIYVGNDVNDVECLAAVGCAVVPADAHASARAVARLVLSKPGGSGAVRELCDLILSEESRGRVALQTQTLRSPESTGE